MGRKESLRRLGKPSGPFTPYLYSFLFQMATVRGPKGNQKSRVGKARLFLGDGKRRIAPIAFLLIRHVSPVHEESLS
jgi:hypothetical protein